MSLVTSYEAEFERQVRPVQTRYIEALRAMMRTYTEAGDLTAANAVKKRLDDAVMWRGLPVERIISEQMKSFDRDDFSEWLQTRTFSFDGIKKVTLEFGRDEVRWTTNKVETFSYHVPSKRRVTIENYVIEFSDDLQSATFESVRGKYPLAIHEPE